MPYVTTIAFRAAACALSTPVLPLLQEFCAKFIFFFFHITMTGKKNVYTAFPVLPSKNSVHPPWIYHFFSVECNLSGVGL
jgi:hypothetical protein